MAILMNLKYMKLYYNNNMIIMLKRNNNIIVSIVTMVLFCACSSDENAYYSDAVIDSKFKTSTVENSRLNSDIDYEVIPVGANNYVYLPKMTTTKAVTRSTESSKTYSVSLNSGLSSNQGPLIVTITWDDKDAYMSVSYGYSYTAVVFTYSINGDSINVQLDFRVLCNGIYIGDFTHYGILKG